MEPMVLKLPEVAFLVLKERMPAERSAIGIALVIAAGARLMDTPRERRRACIWIGPASSDE
jgi:hypothetical protein